MNKYFLMAKGVLSLLLAYYMPAFIPFIAAYWLGVAFLHWRGRRGLALPGAPRVAVEYLGGYPGLAAPQTIWLTLSKQGLTSGGLRLPFAAMRRVRLLRQAEGEELARSLGYPTGGPGQFLALLWRNERGEEREALFLAGGGSAAELGRLVAQIEQMRRQQARERRAGN